MLSKIFSRIFFSILFLDMVALINFAYPSYNLAYGTEEKFDQIYSIKITSCHGNYDATTNPASIDDVWEATNFIHFNNGLWGYLTTYWSEEFKAKEMSEKSFSGNVNLLYSPHKQKLSKHFFMLTERGDEFGELRLFLSTSQKFGKLPRIISTTRCLETIFTNPSETKDVYRYMVELNDGSTWISGEELPSSWLIDWEIGSQIIKIGNSQRPCFINRDSVDQKNSKTIDTENFIPYLKHLN